MSENLPAQFIPELPDAAPFDLWERRFVNIKIVADNWQWLAGDALIYAENHGSDYFDRAIDAAGKLGYEDKTIKNIFDVCKRMPPSRRKDGASYSHHEAVAFVKDKALGDLLLQDAINDKWPVTRLREEIRTASGKPAREPKAKTDWRDEMLHEASLLIDLYGPFGAEDCAGWLKRYRDLVGSAG